MVRVYSGWERGRPPRVFGGDEAGGEMEQAPLPGWEKGLSGCQLPGCLVGSVCACAVCAQGKDGTWRVWRVGMPQSGAAA